MHTILVVDDDAAHRLMLQAVLTDEGYEVAEADDGATAVAAVKAAFYDLILMDVRMTEMDGIEALEAIKQISLGIPVVLMTAYPEVPLAVKAMKLGAVDYLTKPLDTDELRLRIAKMLGHYTLSAQEQAVKTRLAEASRLIGRGAAMQTLLDTVALVAPTDTTVLILGESGTGKEVVADIIHANSDRAAQPLVKVNCAALPETLLESELFGHEKGAFTGAIAKRQGRFAVADGGTIFLDEIGEIPVSVQVKLLRVLQEQQFEPVGSSKTLTVDVRVLAATNRDLEAEIAAGRFREDLFYRLNVFPIHVPPLRERKDDIAALAEHFLEQYAEKHQRQIHGLSPRALDLLMRYEWKGNVRELENTIERSVILCREELIMPQHLPAPLQALSEDLDAETPDLEPGITLKEMEKQLILSTLKQHDGNRTKTAEALGISRRSLQMKLKEYGIS
ncbi:response regulator [candidate division KSB3 bacterium]|uniref:Response regulator n=1 Tax=candidate division KSB3 bacterium TaxID=2044937 RepID=A0A9D5JZF5_9BACT|nr:response regulator [candidate division KSB3 bacterium]MBD3327053.1 response regulator [candidate division KSB3 bacterium]